MFGGLWTRIGLLVAAFATASMTATAACAQTSSRIVAIGDLHGDYEAYRAIIRAAGLVDERDRWTGGTTILVQTGDITDRGPDSLRIIRHLVRLQREAVPAGGRVVTLVGNHEAMNVIGDLRYVHPGEFAAFVDARSQGRRERAFESNRRAILAFYRARDAALTEEGIRQAWMQDTPLGHVEHRAAWRPRGELGRWALASPAVALIDNTLFVHGGISVVYARLPLAEINRRTAAALAARDEAPEAIISDPLGPLWYRGLAMRGGEEGVAASEAQPGSRLSPEEEVAAVLQAYGARRIVIGHTPVLGGIAVLHGGRLIRIDTGIAAHYGGRRTYLEIRDGIVIPHVVGEDQAR